jgi:hypothetical protein
MGSDTDTTIEGLLQQRTQYEQWLARLDSAADKAPPAVRQRVRADYEGRLKGVIDELRGHAATISGELERHRGTQAELDRERRTAEEALAEAEVRHTVGEYSEGEWRRISEESQTNLNRLRVDLDAVGDEISRLAEVQSLIAASPRRSEPPPPPPTPPKVEAVIERPREAPAPAPAPTPAPVVMEPELEIERGTPPPQMAPAPPPPRPAPPPRREAPPPEDELAFLKSVSEEERKPPQRRPSNPGSGGARTAETSAPASTSAATAGKTATPTGAKTLKCAECGTLNRPTEWYCERCGGELAGL